ncbi:unnamed protein product, partial [Ostreobium quekettii]
LEEKLESKISDLRTDIGTEFSAMRTILLNCLSESPQAPSGPQGHPATRHAPSVASIGKATARRTNTGSVDKAPPNRNYEPILYDFDGVGRSAASPHSTEAPSASCHSAADVGFRRGARGPGGPTDALGPPGPRDAREGSGEASPLLIPAHPGRRGLAGQRVNPTALTPALAALTSNSATDSDGGEPAGRQPGGTMHRLLSWGRVVTKKMSGGNFSSAPADGPKGPEPGPWGPEAGPPGPEGGSWSLRRSMSWDGREGGGAAHELKEVLAGGQYSMFAAAERRPADGWAYRANLRGALSERKHCVRVRRPKKKK